VTVRAAVVALALLAGAPTSASAGTAFISGSTIYYSAASGEKNSVGLGYDAGLAAYRITDTTAPVSARGGCGVIGNEVDCTAQDINAVVISLGDGNDTYTGAATPIPPAVNGGDGDDVIGGTGILSGDDGNDHLLAGAGAGILDGGPGDDTLGGADYNDSLDGGPGDDLLTGGDGDDSLTGGEGLDRIDAVDEVGRDTIDCQGRDDEIINANPNDIREGCTGAPRVTVRARRVRPARLASRGLTFTVKCDRPCSVYWELRPDPSLARLLHRGGFLDRHTAKVDSDGFERPVGGSQRFIAKVKARAARDAIARLRSAGVTLYVRATSRSGRVATKTQKLSIR
jgi:Ca2+-binding RTX toxin-like protein